MSSLRRISEDSGAFITALQTQTINITADGDWYTECGLVRVFRWLFSSLEDRRLLNIAEVYNTILRDFERDSITVGKEGIQHAEVYKKFVDVGNAIDRKLSSRTKEKSIRVALSILRRNVLALEYRSEVSLPVEGEVKISDDLRELALKWKQAQIWSRQLPELSPIDLKLLTQACRYPSFLKLLQEDHNLRIRFFKWTLRDHNTVQGFIEFPDVVRRICDCLASSRFGYYAGAGLQVEIRNTSLGLKEKVFSMRYENSEGNPDSVSLLNENVSIRLRNNYELAVKDIFNIFSRKNNRWGKVEVCGGMVCNWDSGKLGRWNPLITEVDRIDLKEKEFWNQLPPGRFMTLTAAQSLSKEVDGKKWIIRAMATRIQEGLGMFGNHAYLYVGIPCNKDGKDGYMFHPMSRFPNKFPGGEVESDYSIVHDFHTAHESVSIATETRIADIASPDGCVYNLARQHGGTVEVVEPEVAYKVMENVREHMTKARNEINYYNVFGPNCAEFTVECFKGTSLQEKYHDLFVTPFTNSEPEGALGWVFKLIKKLRVKWQHSCFRAIFSCAGGDRTLILPEDPFNPSSLRLKSVGLLQNPPWAPGSTYRVPAAAKHLFEKTAAPGLHAACCKHDALEPHALQRLTLSPHVARDDRSSQATPHALQATATATLV